MSPSLLSLFRQVACFMGAVLASAATVIGGLWDVEAAGVRKYLEHPLSGLGVPVDLAIPTSVLLGPILAGTLVAAALLPSTTRRRRLRNTAEIVRIIDSYDGPVDRPPIDVDARALARQSNPLTWSGDVKTLRDELMRQGVPTLYLRGPDAISSDQVDRQWGDLEQRSLLQPMSSVPWRMRAIIQHPLQVRGPGESLRKWQQQYGGNIAITASADASMAASPAFSHAFKTRTAKWWVSAILLPAGVWWVWQAVSPVRAGSGIPATLALIGPWLAAGMIAAAAASTAALLLDRPGRPTWSRSAQRALHIVGGLSLPASAWARHQIDWNQAADGLSSLLAACPPLIFLTLAAVSGSIRRLRSDGRMWAEGCLLIIALMSAELELIWVIAAVYVGLVSEGTRWLKFYPLWLLALLTLNMGANPLTADFWWWPGEIQWLDRQGADTNLWASDAWRTTAVACFMLACLSDRTRRSWIAALVGAATAAVGLTAGGFVWAAREDAYKALDAWPLFAFTLLVPAVGSAVFSKPRLPEVIIPSLGMLSCALTYLAALGIDPARPPIPPALCVSIGWTLLIWRQVQATWRGRSGVRALAPLTVGIVPVVAASLATFSGRPDRSLSADIIMSIIVGILGLLCGIGATIDTTRRAWGLPWDQLIGLVSLCVAVPLLSNVRWWADDYLVMLPPPAWYSAPATFLGSVVGLTTMGLVWTLRFRRVRIDPSTILMALALFSVLPAALPFACAAGAVAFGGPHACRLRRVALPRIHEWRAVWLPAAVFFVSSGLVYYVGLSAFPIPTSMMFVAAGVQALIPACWLILIRTANEEGTPASVQMVRATLVQRAFVLTVIVGLTIATSATVALLSDYLLKSGVPLPPTAGSPFFVLTLVPTVVAAIAVPLSAWFLTFRDPARAIDRRRME